MPKLVALDLPGGPHFVDALRAVWDAGDAAAPLDPRLSLRARQSLLETIRPARVVTPDGEDRAIAGGRPVEEGDALVVATSGSSGRPRAVVLTHAAVAASSHATSQRLSIDPDRHAWLACLPLAHVGGLSVVTRALVTRTRLTVLPGFDAARVEALARDGGVTHVSLVATALGRVDPTVFTRILVGGSRPPGELAPNVVVTYGMTETGSGVVYDGVPLDGVEVAISHFDDGTDGGEILLRGPMVMRGYRDGTTGRVLGPDGRTDWLATGDAGFLTEDGKLAVVGRIAEVITTGGEKVWPDVVERALSTHGGVAQVAVWKRPDDEWGERVVAWIVPVAEPPPQQELRELVADAVAPWAAPKEVVFVAELPRTPSGKIRRIALQ